MAFERDEVLASVVSVVENLIADWDLDLEVPLGSETRLMADLAFESIDVMQFAVSIEQKFERKGLPFEKLFLRDGDYVEEMTLGEVSDFLVANL